MIYWHGKNYPLVRSEYNGGVLGYLLDGILLEHEKAGTKVVGHIVTENGVVIVLQRKMRVLRVAGALVLLILILVLYPREVRHYYLVSFDETPVLKSDVLYCNVVNDAEETITVQFLHAQEASPLYTLQVGESLPYILIDFVPDKIRYNGTYDFQLEVKCDGS
jgi:hypothetical protein